jgi:hypothetical protein
MPKASPDRLPAAQAEPVAPVKPEPAPVKPIATPTLAFDSSIGRPPGRTLAQIIAPLDPSAVVNVSTPFLSGEYMAAELASLVGPVLASRQAWHVA